MSSNLLAQIRKNRALKVTVGKFIFHGRRPTDIEAAELHRNGTAFSEIAAKFVDGWENVLEDDIVGGAVMTPVAFDREVWEEWCADRADFWTPIAKAVLAAYTQYRDSMEQAPKA